MAKKGGVFQALGNLWRWTIWGLAAVLVVALWIGYSNQASGPEGDIVAGAEPPAAPEAELREASENSNWTCLSRSR